MSDAILVPYAMANSSTIIHTVYETDIAVSFSTNRYNLMRNFPSNLIYRALWITITVNMAIEADLELRCWTDGDSTSSARVYIIKFTNFAFSDDSLSIPANTVLTKGLLINSDSGAMNYYGRSIFSSSITSAAIYYSGQGYNAQAHVKIEALGDLLA